MLPQNLASCLFFRLNALRGEPVLRVFRFLMKTDRCSSDELFALQWDKFTRLLKHAYFNVKFYRELYDRHGISPDQIRDFSDLKKLPLLTKRDIQTAGPALRATHLRRRSTTLATTSGSTGTPILLHRDNESWAHLHANLLRGLAWHGIAPGQRYAMVGGVGPRLSNLILAHLKDIVFNRIHLYANDLTTHRRMQFLIDILKQKPAYLYGYPSAIFDLASLARTLPQFEPPTNLKLVVCHGEELFEHQRALIAETFRCTVANSYGCAEAGLIAFECPAGGLHIMAESILLEEQDGEAIITDLNSFASPIIRYAIGDDISFLPGPCSCGRTLPLLGYVRGKLRQIIDLPNGRRVHTVFFNSLFKSFAREGFPIATYQVARQNSFEFEIRLNTFTPLSEHQVNRILQACQAHFGSPCRFTIRLNVPIERTNVGKFLTYLEAPEQHPLVK